MEFFCYHRDRPGSVELRDELSDDGAAWLGAAALVRAPGPDAARAIVTADQ